MARKYDLISELYRRTAISVVASPENWQAFLRSACNNFKLRFDEQLLIFAQRPDATAVLEIDKEHGASWNRTFGRWVNRGARGIAVFEDADRSRQRLIHYFDISDTHPSRFARPVPIWAMKPDYEAEVIETLENTFGELEDKISLPDAILSAAKNAAEDNLPDYAKDLLYATGDSFLEELADDMVAAMYKKTVINSVAYMLMARLGVETDAYFDRYDFEEIVNFNTPETLNALGFATSDIAEMGLKEVSRTILSLDKQNRILAQREEPRYNEGKETDERSFDHERTDLHEAGRLRAARPDAARAAGADDGPLRTDAEEVSEGEPQGAVLQSSDELQDERASSGDRADGKRDGGTTGTADGAEGRADGAEEGAGHDGLGTADEQHPQRSAGDRAEPTDFQLAYFDRTTEDKSLPFFGNDDTIREILLTTPHLKASKEEIRAFFETERDDRTQTEYIKGIFNNDYTEVILGDDRRVGYKTYQNVLHLWEGSYLSRTKQSYYDWGVIAKHFEAARLLGELHDTAKPLPSIEGQLNIMESSRAEEKSSAFSLSQEIIDAVLCRGSGVSEGKMRIYEQFERSLSAKENADFLRDEYGWGGVSPVIVGTGLSEEHSGKGLRISKGFGNEVPHVQLSWIQVEKRIRELIRLDRYLNPREKEAYPTWQEKRMQERAEAEILRQNREILSTAPGENRFADEYRLLSRLRTDCEYYLNAGGRAEKHLWAGNVQQQIAKMRELYALLPEKPEWLSAQDIDRYEQRMLQPEEPAKYAYHLGDTVYLGSAEYEILSFDETRVMLYDPTFPLLNKEVPRAVFDEMVRENPLNDHLKVQPAPAAEYDIGMGYLGNSLTVWNRAVEVDGDYQTIAHIDPDGTIQYRVEGLPEDVIDRIKKQPQGKRVNPIPNPRPSAVMITTSTAQMWVSLKRCPITPTPPAAASSSLLTCPMT